jgi:uncharacterized protein YneF (UPF0154 family)
MLAQILNVTIGLVVGLATGFFFERRSTTAARLENERLRHEMETIRHSVYSVGGSERIGTGPTDNDDLIDRVRERALSTLSSDGSVARVSLEEHFLGRGASVTEIRTAIDQLVARGGWVVDGRELRRE